jgi:hypothetical protein
MPAALKSMITGLVSGIEPTDDLGSMPLARQTRYAQLGTFRSATSVVLPVVPADLPLRLGNSGSALSALGAG